MHRDFKDEECLAPPLRQRLSKFAIQHGLPRRTGAIETLAAPCLTWLHRAQTRATACAAPIIPDRINEFWVCAACPTQSIKQSRQTPRWPAGKVANIGNRVPADKNKEQ